jgi:DNA-binding transcriptional regulator YdaS (Cro superfamily)
MDMRKETFLTDPRAIACELAKTRAGGPVPLASRLGIKRQAVMQWVIVPATRVLEVEKMSGVSRYSLRPDVFGPAPDGKEAAA